jgi:hypothetical protein
LRTLKTKKESKKYTQKNQNASDFSNTQEPEGSGRSLQNTEA